MVEQVAVTHVTVLRWLARFWGLILTALALILLVLPDPNASVISPAEYLIPLLLFGGVTLGWLIAWRREALGGAVILLGWIASMIWDHFVYERWLPLRAMGLIGLAFATPGVIYLYCAWRSGRPRDVA